MVIELFRKGNSPENHHKTLINDVAKNFPSYLLHRSICSNRVIILLKHSAPNLHITSSEPDYIMLCSQKQ